MKKIISAHNKKVLATKKPPIPLEEEQVITNCNCSERTPPMPYKNPAALNFRLKTSGTFDTMRGLHPSVF